MYYNYWKLQKPPFDNVPDPAMYVDCHASLENAIAETLFAIEEGNECLAVIVGEVGLGKTLSIRMIIDSLSQDKYRIAMITNPGISFIQLLREIIGQLSGELCTEKKKADLFELFNKILFDTYDEGKKVLIFIDEGNAISPANLESLRLLTNMQDDRQNLFTIILVGQMELARRLEHPKRANLFQRIGTFSRIDKIQSVDLVKTYIETRLRLAGGGASIFTDEAVALLWEYSEQGVPRLINKIAKLCLKAGETNGFNQIDGEIVRQIGDRFRNLTGQVLQKRKPRKRMDENGILDEKEYGTLSSPAISDGEIGKELIISDQLTSAPVGQVIMMPSEDSERFGYVEVEENDQPIQAWDERLASITEEKKGTVHELLEIRGIKIAVDIPQEMLQEAPCLKQEQRMKSAGILAAQVLKQCRELTADPNADPFILWNDIRKILIDRLDREGQAELSPVQAAIV